MSSNQRNVSSTAIVVGMDIIVLMSEVTHFARTYSGGGNGSKSTITFWLKNGNTTSINYGDSGDCNKAFRRILENIHFPNQVIFTSE